MKRKTNSRIVICLSGVLALIAAVGTTSPAFAHTQYYNIGYSQGQQKASEDASYTTSDGTRHYSPYCPTDDAWTQSIGPHSSNFCAGFIDGYNAQWTSLAPGFMQFHWARVNQQFKNDQQIDQNSNVRINGDNNKVVVNQQASNNAQQQTGGNVYYPDGSSSSGHHDGSGINPRCAVLCANVQVR